jgi:hypothetical protein
MCLLESMENRKQETAVGRNRRGQGGLAEAGKTESDAETSPVSPATKKIRAFLPPTCAATVQALSLPPS